MLFEMLLCLLANFSSVTCQIVGINFIQRVIPKNFYMAEPGKVQPLCSADETNEAGFRVGHRSICTALHTCGRCSASGPNANIRGFDGDMYIPVAFPHVPHCGHSLRRSSMKLGEP